MERSGRAAIRGVVKIVAQRGLFALIRLPASSVVPDWLDGSLVSITRTADELSIVVEERVLPAGSRPAERGWRVLKVEGPLETSQIGVLASIASPLAAAEVSLLALSTYDTDYVLVRDEHLQKALEALRVAGHEVSAPPDGEVGSGAERVR